MICPICQQLDDDMRVNDESGYKSSKRSCKGPMNNWIFIITIGVVIAIIGQNYYSRQAQAGLFGPSSYDECILENMKGVTSNLAVGTIISACKKKFPTVETACKDFDLNPTQLNNLKGTGRFSGDSFYVDVYNGNSDIAIGEIKINIKDLTTQEIRLYQASPSQAYKTSLAGWCTFYCIRD
jgi:hypothetical protein